MHNGGLSIADLAKISLLNNDQLKKKGKAIAVTDRGGT
jgi:hypothetical protein